MFEFSTGSSGGAAGLRTPESLPLLSITSSPAPADAAELNLLPPSPMPSHQRGSSYSSRMSEQLTPTEEHDDAADAACEASSLGIPPEQNKSHEEGERSERTLGGGEGECKSRSGEISATSVTVDDEGGNKAGGAEQDKDAGGFLTLLEHGARDRLVARDQGDDRFATKFATKGNGLDPASGHRRCAEVHGAGVDGLLSVGVCRPYLPASEEEARAVSNAMGGVDEWGWDVWELHKACQVLGVCVRALIMCKWRHRQRRHV